MIVTGAFFAEEASVVDGKLNVRGGVWDWLTVPSVGGGASYALRLVVLLQAGPDDAEGTTIAIQVVGPDGSLLVSDSVSASTPLRGEQRFLFADFTIAFRAPGRHVFQVSASSETPTSVPLDVRVAG